MCVRGVGRGGGREVYRKLSAVCVQGGGSGNYILWMGITIVCCVLSAVCCLLCAVCCVLSAVCCLLCVCAGGVKVALTYETYELGYTDDLQDPNSSRFLAHRQKVCSDVSEAFSFLPFHWHLCLPISIFMKNAYVCIQNLKQE